MPLPPESSLDDVKVKIRQAYSNPSVRNISQVVLKDGPKVFRIATLLEIIDRSTGAFHHYSLKIDQIARKPKAGWFTDPEKSVRLEGDSPDEVDRLYTFLHAIRSEGAACKSGQIHIIRSDDYQKLEALLDAVPDLATSDKIQLIRTVFDQIQASQATIHDFVAAFEGSNPDSIKHIARASRYIDYRKAIDHLRCLVDTSGTTEQEFQSHLSENPWMFGSEYSQLLPRRKWTRDDNLDYMLRRTVDGYLEIVEIKTAFTEKLFIHDRSHDSFYPSSRLSTVLGQVMRYVEEVERARDGILAKDGFDCLKIRARIILGRDGDVAEQAALRKFNSHLHAIEILTYDQLMRIAERVVGVFDPPVIPSDESDTEISF